MRRLKVLVVDDIADVCVSTKNLCDEWGFVARYATSGAEAIEIAREFCLDVVLLDLQMPEMDGYEVANILHKSQPDLYIIAVTGLVEEINKYKAYDGHFTKYMTKPVATSHLLKVLSNHARTLEIEEKSRLKRREGLTQKIAKRINSFT